MVIAQRFNPTAAGEYQLITQGVLTKDEVGKGCIFTDMLVQVQSDKFRMLLLPEQLQFIPMVPPSEEQQLIIDKLGKLVRTLPITPYKGVGLNFTWHYEPRDKDINRLTREMFCVPDRPLYQAFGETNARYGGYLSKDFNAFRLKLDINPVLVTQETDSNHRLQFTFNFHRDLGEDGAAELQSLLGQWDIARAEAERIIDTIEKRV